MNKKLIAILLASMMLLGIVACGEDSSTSTSESPKTSESSASKESETVSETNTTEATEGIEISSFACASNSNSMPVGDEQTMIFTAKVTGNTNEDDVLLAATDNLGNDYSWTMHDDGVNGDIVAHNGTYSMLIKNDISTPRTITFYVKVNGLVSDDTITMEFYETSNEKRDEEIAFIDKLKTDHPDWYEDYLNLAEVLECYGKSMGEVEETYELKRSYIDGDGCYRLDNDYSWFGVDGRYVLWFLDGKVQKIDFVLGHNAFGDYFDLLLEGIEEFFGEPPETDHFEQEWDYNWDTDVHMASFYAYRYAEGNQAHGGIMFVKNSDYDYSVLTG